MERSVEQNKESTQKLIWDRFVEHFNLAPENAFNITIQQFVSSEVSQGDCGFNRDQRDEFKKFIRDTIIRVMETDGKCLEPQE